MEPSKVKPFPFGMIHYSPSGDAVQYPQVMKDILKIKFRHENADANMIVPDQPAFEMIYYLQ